MSRTHSEKQWQRVEAALDEILELPKEQWAAASERLAAGDTGLLREIRSLLDRVGGVDEVLDRPSPHDEPAAAASLAPATLVGPYRIIALIGRGGMGEVYSAERADGQFQQQVALKLLGLSAGEHLLRFHVERQILARLEHPGIARLLDGGVFSDGRPYMAMELVAGEPITEWCRHHGADLGLRLRLLNEVCAAVAYAHQNLVVHRDLKPSNVLVTAEAGVKLLDFGVAKLLTEDIAQQTRNVPMTPGYAAPEQLTGGVITTGTDVFALGLLMFELLCGDTPWARTGTFAMTLSNTLSREPPTPSRFMPPDEGAGQPGTGQSGDARKRRLQAPVPPRSLRGDLDAIILKALKKDPVERYATADSLARDIQAFRSGTPVSARPDSRAYRVRKFIARNKAASIAATVTLVAILAAAIVSILAARAADRERDRALAFAERNAGINEFLTYLITDAASSDKPITISEMLARSERLAALENQGDPDTQAAVLDVISMQYRSLGDDARAEPIARHAMELAGTSSDSSLLPRIAADHAMTLAGLGKVDEARSLLENLADDPKVDPETSANALQSLAYIAQDQLDAAAALDYSQRALTKLRQVPRVSRDTEATFLGTLALSLSLVERNVEADEKFKQSLDLYTATGHAGRSDAISVRNNWGMSRQTAGDPQQALALLEQTRRQLAASDPTLPPPGYLIGNIARAQESLGRYADAESTNRACVDAARQRADERNVAYCSFGLAIDALEQGRVADAERFRDEGFKSAARLETMPRALLFARQLAVGRIALHENRLDMARDAFVAVIGTGDNVKVPFLALIGVASVDLAQGDCNDAEKHARRALQIATERAGGEPYSFASGYAWLTLARVAAARNDDKAAREAAHAAVVQLTNTVDPSLPALQVARALAAGAPIPPGADELSGKVAAKDCRDLQGST